MKMTHLAKLLIETAKVYGDREVAIIDETLGEIRYVEAMSFDSVSDKIYLEHINEEEKALVEKMNRLEKMGIPLEIVQII